MAEPSTATTSASATPSSSITIVDKTPQEPDSKSPPSSTSAIATPIPTSPTTELDSSKRTAEARTAFLASLQAIGSTADIPLQNRAKDIASNSQALAKQQAQVEKDTAALAKETDKYAKLADETRDQLKDIGDVQNFTEMMERELMVLEETLRIVEEGEDRDGEGDVEVAGEEEGKDKVNGKKRWWF